MQTLRQTRTQGEESYLFSLVENSPNGRYYCITTEMKFGQTYKVVDSMRKCFLNGRGDEPKNDSFIKAREDIRCKADLYVEAVKGRDFSKKGENNKNSIPKGHQNMVEHVEENPEFPELFPEPIEEAETTQERHKRAKKESENKEIKIQENKSQA